MLGICWGVVGGPEKLRDGALTGGGGEGGPLKLNDGSWEEEGAGGGGPSRPRDGNLESGEEGGALKLYVDCPVARFIVDTGGESSRLTTSREPGVRGRGGTPTGQLFLRGVPFRPAAANIRVRLPPPSITPGALLASKFEPRISGGRGSVDARPSRDGGWGRSRIPYCGDAKEGCAFELPASELTSSEPEISDSDSDSSDSDSGPPCSSTSDSDSDSVGSGEGEDFEGLAVAGERTCNEPPRLSPPLWAGAAVVAVAGAEGSGRPLLADAFPLALANPRFHNGINFPPVKGEPAPERRSLNSLGLAFAEEGIGFVGSGREGGSDQEPEPPVNRGGDARRLICDCVSC